MQDLVASYTSLRGRVIELSPFLGKVKKAGSPSEAGRHDQDPACPPVRRA
jgi:hypothetical protein